MTMNCKQAQRELALWVGGDHDPLLQEMLNDHVRNCPDCRAFAREIQTGAQVLRQAAVRASNDAPVAEAGWSLWPRVQAKLAKSGPRQSPYAPATVGWFPVAGLTAACVALIAVSFSSVQSYRSDPAFEFPLGHTTLCPRPARCFCRGRISLLRGVSGWRLRCERCCLRSGKFRECCRSFRCGNPR
ncbi:MAG: hypothetical protein U0903_21060 [Planctomycetales bacterium]